MPKPTTLPNSPQKDAADKKTDKKVIRKIGTNFGTVKFYDTEKGFGFIKPDNGDNDVFAHVSEVQQSGLSELVRSQKVTFDIKPDKKGKRIVATNIRIDETAIELPQPHDALFRALLGDPERAGHFIHENLPNNIAALLSKSKPHVMDGSFVDEALAKSQSDLLLKAHTMAGGTAFVYLLIEHKSYPDHIVPLQLATYMTRIWQRHLTKLSRRKKDRPLPPIIPMVLYHGEQNWTVPAGLGDMIDADDPDLVVLPGQSYIFRDLGQIDDEVISQHVALRAGLLALKRTTIEVLAKALADLHHASNPAQGDAQIGSPELIRQILTYIVHTHDGLDLSGLVNEIGQHDKTLEASVGTIAETLIQKGEVRGEARGMAAGIAEGEARGMAAGIAEGEVRGEARGVVRGEARGKAKGAAASKAEDLILLLESRFGSLQDKTRTRINEAKLAELDTWFRKALKASSIHAVFTTNH